MKGTSMFPSTCLYSHFQLCILMSRKKRNFTLAFQYNFSKCLLNKYNTGCMWIRSASAVILRNLVSSSWVYSHESLLANTHFLFCQNLKNLLITFKTLNFTKDLKAKTCKNSTPWILIINVKAQIVAEL